MLTKNRMIIGISGASGAIYGVRLLQALKMLSIERHLIMTRSAAMTLAYETDFKVSDLRALADRTYPVDDLSSVPASGSFQSTGMVVAPCSMRTLAEIAAGLSSNLLTRAAEVTLKERRRLVLMARETPLHLVHIKNMLAVTEMGAIVAPPVPAFYARPGTIDAMIDHSVGRVLDLFGIDNELAGRWDQVRGQGLNPRPG